MYVILRTWWPLALSWLLMGCERPVVSAVIARLPDPAIHLAAYGGVVFPLSLVIESPVIMLLAASTALAKSWAWYRFLRAITLWLGFGLTSLHGLVAFTSLFDVVVRDLLGIPPALVEPARVGMQLMTPWTAAIAFRRFQQGVLIRDGHTHLISWGTVVRLMVLSGFLVGGAMLTSLSGIAVGTLAISLGVISEALFINRVVQPTLKRLRATVSRSPSLPSLAWFAKFYMPLATTPLLTLLALPLASAALSRMPNAVESLAVWPVVGGLVFLFQSLGLAYQEVVVALLDKPGTRVLLYRFTQYLALGVSIPLGIFAITPLARLWFVDVSGLLSPLAHFAESVLWMAVAIPALAVIESWFQGILVYHQQTHGIIEAVGIYLVASGFLLGLGILYDQIPGLYVGYGATLMGLLMQILWLWRRSRILSPLPNEA
ncbi:MAG: hypothetical protein D6704_11505 [Nitrospirae bacterium]|nr:MAG: hypothetical protein D6704_11505 [Nitrospirota bacterium]